MSFSFLFLTSLNNEASSNETTSQEIEKEEEDVVETGSSLLKIEPGNRAITIPVDEIQSVSGFVEPNSYVDVISVLNNPVTSQILLQNVRVLAVGKTLEDTETETQEPYTMVTLELNPNDAMKLTLATQNGFITLMLRSADDQEAASNVSISLEQLSKGQMPK